MVILTLSLDVQPLSRWSVRRKAASAFLSSGKDFFNPKVTTP